MLNSAYFDLIGQFNYLDIDERCQPAEAEQKMLLLMFFIILKERCVMEDSQQISAII